MSRGLGKLQKCILEQLYKLRTGQVKMEPTTTNVYLNVEEDYWGEVIHRNQYKWGECWMVDYDEADKPELNRRRAAIGQAIASLKRRELVGYYQTDNLLFITDKGVETLKIKSLNT